MFVRTALVVALGIAFAPSAIAQSPAANTRPGTATDVSGADIEAANARTASAAVSDQQLRVVDIDNEYQVGIGVLHRRAYRPGQDSGNAIEHSEITEVYHVMRGSGTFVTGGTMEHPKPAAPDSAVVKVLNGPSTTGGKIAGGISRRVVPGDVIVIPPNTPHWFSDIDGEIVYLVIRIDPHHVLPRDYKLDGIK